MLNPDTRKFIDTVTDMEDALQRMVVLCREAGEDDAAAAASTAAGNLLALEQVLLSRAATVPVPDMHLC